jgi:hypothetical protein
MPVLTPRRLLHRYAHRIKPEKRALDGLVEALQTLLRLTSREDPFFLMHGLELLLENLGGACAYLVMMGGETLEAQWWVPSREDEPGPEPVPSFCRWLQDNPFRTLALRDIRNDPHWQDDPVLAKRGIRAAAGAALWGEGRLKGLVFVHYPDPHRFSRPELALLDAVAGFMGRILESEDLKFALSRLENSLAITKAVVEDSSIHDPATKLPNLRYLDIWLKANLSLASPDRELMTIAEWHLPGDARAQAALIREVAEGVRGGDLLVSLGKGRFLLILQRMPKGMGHIFLLRLRHRLGELPMGATLWVPGVDDAHLESARRRIASAIARSAAMERPALVWELPDFP